jgi:DNA-directed RNA polymerase specialized sigma24 family protein
MANCRDIPPAVWAHARDALVRFFATRFGLAEAEELAHDTLLAILQRDDYTFADPGDFLKVCYGFARNIRHAANRKLGRSGAEIAVENETIPPLPSGRLEYAELARFLEEVLRVGRQDLKQTDWDIICRAASAVLRGEEQGFDKAAASRLRARLSRARQRLRKKVGWGSDEV